jgi:hypothetical protein
VSLPASKDRVTKDRVTIGHDAGAPMKADGYVLADSVGQTFMTGQKAIRGLKLRFVFLGLNAACGGYDSRTQKCRDGEPAREHYFHPLNKLPSNQSHNT